MRHNIRKCSKYLQEQVNNKYNKNDKKHNKIDRLCGLVVRVSGYRYRDPGFDSLHFQIFWEALCLERGPLSLVRTTEELLEGKVAALVYKTEINDRENPSRWLRDTSILKSWHYFAKKRRLLSPHSSLADQS
jgi:hypothetical protein